MENFISFPIKNGVVDFGNARNLCFGCGEVTSDETTVYFEDTQRISLFGKFQSLVNRKSISIPICPGCGNVVSSCRRKIFLWGGMFLAVVFAGFGLIEVCGVDLGRNFWPMLLVMGVSIFPMSRIKRYWIMKDRGGAFVDLAGENDSSITLS
ncbi:MAG: hypothetical protein V1809_12275, partial [Planctomycetota bacterium]